MRIIVTRNNKVKHGGRFYIDQGGMIWMDQDPYGVDMSGKRTIRPAPQEYQYTLEEDNEVSN